MYQTPSPTPSKPVKRGRKRRSDRSKLSFSFEIVLAAGLTVAVAAGLVVAGGSGRLIEVVVLFAAAGIGLARGWPVSGHAALGAGAAYLILETVFGRLDGSHAPSTLLLTAGVLGSVLAAGFARRGNPGAERAMRAEEAPWKPVDPWAAEIPGRSRLTAGTLEYEIERARRSERPVAMLAIVPDELDFLAAGAGDALPTLLDLIDAAIEDALRAIDIVERIGRARFRAVLPETGTEGARTVAERIRLRIDSTRPDVGGRPVGVSVSIGVATYPADGADDITLEAAAERALARAQELGGNRTVLFSVPAGAPRGWGITAGAGTRPPQP